MDSIATTLWSMAVRLAEITRDEGGRAAAAAARRYVRNQLNRHNNNPIQSLRYGRLIPTLGILTDIVIGTNVYIEYLSRYHGNPTLIGVNDYQMLVDLDDSGLSRDLIAYGTREPHSTRAFRAVLQRLKTESNNPVTILEVGANIGYFVLLEASALEEQADIHAFEPSPANIDLLEKNVDLNGIGDQIKIIQAAIGAESGTAELELTDNANQNFVPHKDIDPKWIETNGRRISVDQLSIGDYLAEAGLKPEDVDVLRMDIEGFEYVALKGAQPLLDANSDLVFLLEVHPTWVLTEKQDELVEWLDQAGFEPIYSADKFKTPTKFPEKRIDHIDDLRTTHCEVILRRRS